MKTLLLIVMLAAIGCYANETNNVTSDVFTHGPPVTPLVAYAIKGADVEMVETQLLAITNASGQRIYGNLNPTNVTEVAFYFFKTNGVPYRAHLLVK